MLIFYLFIYWLIILNDFLKFFIFLKYELFVYKYEIIKSIKYEDKFSVDIRCMNVYCVFFCCFGSEVRFLYIIMKLFRKFFECVFKCGF